MVLQKFSNSGPSCLVLHCVPQILSDCIFYSTDRHGRYCLAKDCKHPNHNSHEVFQMQHFQNKTYTFIVSKKWISQLLTDCNTTFSMVSCRKGMSTFN